MTYRTKGTSAQSRATAIAAEPDAWYIAHLLIHGIRPAGGATA